VNSTFPDAFSPNDDGSNDYFKVLCIEKYPNAKFEVYNRWGNLLYEQENYGNQDRWNSIDAWVGWYIQPEVDRWQGETAHGHLLLYLAFK